MTDYLDEIESLLDETDLAEFEERTRRRRTRSSVPTPSSRNSFQPRRPPTAASQSQVQATARSLDTKIETLTKAVKGLESRTNALGDDLTRTSTALAKETSERKKNTDAVRADLQQSKMLSVLLPMINQETVELEVHDHKSEVPSTKTVKVLAPSDNQFASFLPLLLLFGGSSTESGKGPGGMDLNTLLLFSVVANKGK